MDEKRQSRIAKLIGEAISRRRVEARLTQEEVAEQIGIGSEAISRIERGAVTPSVVRLFDFADCFGCRVDEFLLTASDREVDQAQAFGFMLRGLSPRDRETVIEVAEKLSGRFRGNSSKGSGPLR